MADAAKAVKTVTTIATYDVGGKLLSKTVTTVHEVKSNDTTPKVGFGPPDRETA